MTDKLIQKIDYAHYQDLLSLVIETTVGDNLPGELEARVKDFSPHCPLVEIIGGVLVKAVKHYQEWNELPKCERDKPENVRGFLQNNEILGRTQGALAILLVVGELFLANLKANPKKPKTRSSPPKKFRQQKIKKGIRS